MSCLCEYKIFEIKVLLVRRINHWLHLDCFYKMLELLNVIFISFKNIVAYDNIKKQHSTDVEL
jgi:hypothetical protein